MRELNQSNNCINCKRICPKFAALCSLHVDSYTVITRTYTQYLLSFTRTACPLTRIHTQQFCPLVLKFSRQKYHRRNCGPPVLSRPPRCRGAPEIVSAGTSRAHTHLRCLRSFHKHSQRGKRCVCLSECVKLYLCQYIGTFKQSPISSIPIFSPPFLLSTCPSPPVPLGTSLSTCPSPPVLLSICPSLCSFNTDKASQIEQLLALVSKLPEANRLTLHFLCAFLSRVNANSEINKMSYANLATW